MFIAPGIPYLEGEDGRCESEGEEPDGEVDERYAGAGHPGGEAGGDLGDGEPAVHRDGGHGVGADEDRDGLGEGDEAAHRGPEWPVVQHEADLRKADNLTEPI